MGKKKTPFIDKNNSSTYHLLHRSQRDAGNNEDGSGVILWPNPENNKETDDKVLDGGNNTTKLGQWKDQMQEAGLVDDYDYEKHMMPITGSGDFFASDGHRANALQDPRAAPREEGIQEMDRQLDSIAMTADCMDDDVALAMFGEFDEGDFEEILDDFCLTAAEEATGEEVAEEEFDFDAHIQQLMEKARLQREDKGVDAEEHDQGRQDQAFFSKGQALHRHAEEEEYDYDIGDLEGAAPGIAPALNPDEEKALCDKFAQTLLEYDSDEVGDLDEECRYIGGERELEGDKLFDSALDQYLVERDDGMFMEAPNYLKGSGFRTLQLPGTQQQQPDKFAEVMAEATDFLRTPELDLPPEEILIDGQSYFSLSSRNPWDCESVLSTYSNLDNNPVTIDGGRRRGKKKKKQISAEPVVEEEDEHEHEHVQIQLSNKTGLPLGVLPGREKGDDFDFDTIASVNKGERRNKTEDATQKKIRKQQIKQERQVARIQKKMMKEAFRDEFMKADTNSDDIAGKSVFRF